MSDESTDEKVDDSSFQVDPSSEEDDFQKPSPKRRKKAVRIEDSSEDTSEDDHQAVSDSDYLIPSSGLWRTYFLKLLSHGSQLPKDLWTYILTFCSR